MRKGLLSPKVDFVFKKIFGSPEHPNILISFLNATLKPDKPIVSVDIKNTDIEKNYPSDKFSRLDIKATTNNKEVINIEIQLKNEYNMTERSLYYWSKLYEEQLSEGDKYRKLNRTICINILNFKHLKHDNFHSVYRLKEVNTNEELTDLQEIHFIELPKLKDLKIDDDTNNLLDVWVEFIKNPNSEVVKKLELSNKDLKEAKETLTKLSLDEKERELYSYRTDTLRDMLSAYDNAERRGIEKGIKQGIEQSKLETALKLKGIVSDEEIASILELDIETVRKIEKEIL